MAAPVLSGLLLLGQAWLMSRIIGNTLTQKPDQAQAGVVMFIMAIIGIMVVRATISWVGERAASMGAERIKTQLRNTLFVHLLEGGPDATQHMVAGELSSTLVDQIDMLDGFFIRYLPSAIAAGFLPLAFGVVLLPVDWIVALLLLLTAPFIPLFMMLIGWGAEAASRQHQTAMTRLAGYFSDRLRGAFTLALFGRTQAEVENVRQASVQLSRKTMTVLRLAFLSSAVLELFAALGVAGVAVYVGLSYLGYLGPVAGPSSLQAGLFCLLLAPEVYSPLRQFAANYHDRAAAKASMAQLHAVFGALPVVTKTADGEPALRFPDSAPTLSTMSSAYATATFPHGPSNQQGAGALVFQVRDLTIRLGQRPDPILSDVSLDILQGQKVALMGHSGSGKTSLLHALAGIRAPASGQVSFAGQPLQASRSLNIHDGVALLSQQPFIMAASLADNLRLAAAQATDADLWKALDSACLHDEVSQLPQGLDTVLGVAGYGWSGGQLHRLALARVFLSQADVLLLDEPTAHLDSGTRDRVLTAILDFAVDRTLLIATHDPEVASRLDSVWCIQNQQVQNQQVQGQNQQVQT